MVSDSEWQPKGVEEVAVGRQQRMGARTEVGQAKVPGLRVGRVEDWRRELRPRIIVNVVSENIENIGVCRGDRVFVLFIIDGVWVEVDMYTFGK